MQVLGLLLSAIGLTMAASTGSNATPFASELFYTIAKEKSAENIIFSPASIQTCLALTYLGAEGVTASELQKGLHLSEGSKQQVAEEYGQLLAKTKTDGKLKMANRIYVAKKFEIAPKFNELASKYFNSSAESVEFGGSSKTAEKINSWIEQQTEHKIKNLLSEDSLDADTASVLVNAIYFKAQWENIFDITEKKDFLVSKTRKVPVDMMYQKDDFLYGDLKELDATAVELGYVDTDITMLVLLPKSVDGLSALEAKLKNIDLTKLTSQLHNEKVRLHLPKFKIEFDISLQPALEKLGMKTLFTSAADFSSLLASKENLAISEVKHKAFIEVNESGTEAAGSTYVKAVLQSLIINEVVVDFVADHPFFFAIKDKQNVYFTGHIAQF